MPNADTDGRILFQQIYDFCELNPLATAHTSLGQLRYLSCIKHVDGVIGNSPSGLLEVPSFRKGTVNIGDRQWGRLCAESVINCSANEWSMTESIARLFTPSFLELLLKVKNPYGDGGASAAVIRILEQRSFDNLLKKPFFDLASQWQLSVLDLSVLSIVPEWVYRFDRSAIREYACQLAFIIG